MKLARMRRAGDESGDFNKIYQKTEAMEIFINFSSEIFPKSYSRENFPKIFLLNLERGRQRWAKRREMGNGFSALIKIRFD